ncbi:MAG: amphi-Trp domain-containing protein [Spirochaetales bacterium]
MAQKKQLFKSKEAHEREEIAEYLQTLAREVQEGKVDFEEADEPVTVTLPRMVRMQLKAGEKRSENKGVKHSISLKLSWRDSDG